MGHGQDYLASPAGEVTPPFNIERWLEAEVTAEKREEHLGRVVDLRCGGGIGATAEGKYGAGGMEWGGRRE